MKNLKIKNLTEKKYSKSKTNKKYRAGRNEASVSENSES